MTERVRAPKHLLEHARTARNAQDEILNVVDEYLAGDIDAHKALMKITRITGGAKRELEQIKGVETPPDENFLKVVNGG